MAKRMDVTDSGRKLTYKGVVWFPAFVALDTTAPSATVEWLPYADEDAARAVLTRAVVDPTADKVDPLAISAKRYTLTPEQFAQFAMSKPTGATIMDAIANAAYAIMTQTKDKVVDSKDPSKNTTFFGEAEDVDITPKG